MRAFSHVCCAVLLGTDLVCLLINDTQASDLHDSIAMTCGESAFMVAACWFDPACPESATRSLLVVTAETLWRYQRLAFVSTYLPRVFASKGQLSKSPLSIKAQPGNPDGKEWMRFSHAPVVEQMLLASHTMIDGIEILRKWMGLGERNVEDFADPAMKDLVAVCCKLLHYFVSYLRSDEDANSEAPPSDQRLQKIVNRLRVLFAYADNDTIVFPINQAVCFIGMIPGKSIQLCQHPSYVTVSKQILNEPARRDEKTGNVGIDHSSLMQFFGAIYASGDESAIASMVDLIDSGNVTTTAGENADPGVDNDTAYSIESLKQQLDRRRPVDKYEFSAASCICNRTAFASNLAHLTSFVERLYYRPAAGLVEHIHQNMTEILRLRGEVHCCPATFDLPVAWFRSSSGTSDVHVRTRLPLFENKITDETDAPRSLHFILMSMSEVPFNDKLQGFLSKGDVKRQQPPHWRDRPDRVPRLGAIRQPRPVESQPAPPEVKVPAVAAPVVVVPAPEAKAPDPVPIAPPAARSPPRDPRIYTFLPQQNQQQQPQPMEDQPQQQQQPQKEPPANAEMEQDDFEGVPEAAAVVETVGSEFGVNSEPEDGDGDDDDAHWKRIETKEDEKKTEAPAPAPAPAAEAGEVPARTRSASRSKSPPRRRSAPRRSKSRPRKARSRSRSPARKSSNSGKR